MDMKQRNYGIDLLRLVSMYMVCLLHTLGKGGILEACSKGSLDHEVYLGIEIISYCAVDIFAIISGYVASDKRSQKYEKIVSMWMQVFFYSFVLTVILMVGLRQSIPFKELIKYALPVTYGKYWYFSGYFLLFFAIPALNSILFSLDNHASKKMLVVIIALFTIPALIADPFSVKVGYSALWLIVLYCVGVLSKRINLFANISTGLLIGLLIGCNLITWIGYNAGLKLMLNYTSPSVLLSAIIWVVLFSRLSLKGTVIKRVAPLSFGIYLFQLNHTIYHKVISGAFAFCAEKSIIVGVVYVFLIAAIIFISGLVVEVIRVHLYKLLRIHRLAGRIADFAAGCVDKVAVALD